MSQMTYFEWLCDQVGICDRPGRRYFSLAKRLFDTPFYSIVDGDENREADGTEFRFGFKDAPHGSCNCFELVVGLSIRLTFMADGLMPPEDNSAEEWFFQMISNLGLAVMQDEDYMRLLGDFVTDESLTIFLKREYEFNGLGGLFPLERPSEDQRRRQIWYQMNDYLMERIGGIGE